MKLLLGRINVIAEYAETNLKMNKEDIVYYPTIPTHHTELGKYVDVIKEHSPSVITTQSVEMMDTLLASDLDFEVITVRKVDKVIHSRSLSKNEVVEDRKKFCFDPRD